MDEKRVARRRKIQTYRFQLTRTFEGFTPGDYNKIWGKIGPDYSGPANRSAMIFDTEDGAKFFSRKEGCNKCQVSVSWVEIVECEFGRVRERVEEWRLAGIAVKEL